MINRRLNHDKLTLIIMLILIVEAGPVLVTEKIHQENERAQLQAKEDIGKVIHCFSNGMCIKIPPPNQKQITTGYSPTPEGHKAVTFCRSIGESHYYPQQQGAFERMRCLLIKNAEDYPSNNIGLKNTRLIMRFCNSIIPYSLAEEQRETIWSNCVRARREELRQSPN